MSLPRVTVGRLMIAVAVVAVPFAVWAAWFDPVRRWKRSINDDQNGEARWRAIDEVLKGRGEVDDPTALASLVDALRSPSPAVRETAVVGLGRLGSRARPAVDALIATLDDPTPRVRATVAGLLHEVLPPGDPRREAIAPKFVRMLRDPYPPARLNAASTLVEFGRWLEALPTLLEFLRRDDYATQTDVLWRIGRIGPPAAPGAMAEVIALEERARSFVAPEMSRYLRIYAAEARYLLGDRASLEAIRAIAAGPDAELATEARRALSRLAESDRAGSN